MAGNFSGACRRVMRRAVAVSTGTFFLAVLAGIVAWATAAPQSLPAASQLASVFNPPAELSSSAAPASWNSSQGGAPMVVSVTGDALVAGQQRLAENEADSAAEMAATMALVQNREPRSREVVVQATQSGPTFDSGSTADDTARQAGAVQEAPAPPADLVAGAQVEATVSYYYCQQGQEPRGIGDGGGFCGAMRNGEAVYPGAAACAHAYLGQHFRIVGDPLERVYTCADTGSAVHGQHRDIWFMNSDDGMYWQAAVGRNVVLEILE